MTKIRTIVVGLVLATALFAQGNTVYFTQHGKTFHTNRHCMALSRATAVYSADRAAAESHGLKPCGICNRAKKSTKVVRSNDWAK